MALHVIPVGDLIAHTASDECPCTPVNMPAERPDGSFGWLAIHHSLDGREWQERADRGATSHP